MDFWLGLACTHSSPWIIQVLETYSESLGGSRRNETTRDLGGVLGDGEDLVGVEWKQGESAGVFAADVGLGSPVLDGRCVFIQGGVVGAVTWD